MDTGAAAARVQGVELPGCADCEAANLAANGESIAAVHAAGSSVEVWVVPTDEGRVAAQDAARLMRGRR